MPEVYANKVKKSAFCVVEIAVLKVPKKTIKQRDLRMPVFAFHSKIRLNKNSITCSLVIVRCHGYHHPSNNCTNYTHQIYDFPCADFFGRFPERE